MPARQSSAPTPPPKPNRPDQWCEWTWEPVLDDVLADPIVRMLMRSDGLTESDFRDRMPLPEA